MEDAFTTLIWIVVAVAVLVAVYTLAVTGRSYREIGANRLGGGSPAPDTAAERDEEIRQLLEARNARRVARGEAPVDVEAELQALTASPVAVDDGLRDEIREHVVARNARRVRAGDEPLDVDAEVKRRVRELT